MSGVQHLLGKLIEGPQQKDAIHVAVAPVVAGEKLYPGQHVGFAANGSDGKTVFLKEKPLGLVDPYLAHPVQSGESFWLFLYPGSASVVRHEWTHPAFVAPVVVVKEDSEKEVAEKWLRNFAANDIGVLYDYLISGATNFLERGDYLHGGEQFEGAYVGDDFWDRYEIVTGRKVPSSSRGSFFSCSC